MPIHDASLPSAAILALCLGAFSLPARAADRNSGTAAPSCSLLRYASVDMTTGPSGSVTVPVKVNGRSLPFLIDTGGFFGGITEATVKAMNLPLQRLPPFTGFVFYGGAEVTRETVADTYALGELVAKNVEIPVLPSAVLPPDSVGLIAGNVLSHYDVELDFYNQKLNLFAPKHCPAGVFETSRDAPGTPVRGWDRRPALGADLARQPG